MGEKLLTLKVKGDVGEAKAALADLHSSSATTSSAIAEIKKSFESASRAGAEAFNGIVDAVKKGGPQIGQVVGSVSESFLGSTKGAQEFGQGLTALLSGNYLGAFLAGMHGLADALDISKVKLRDTSGKIGDLANAIEDAHKRMLAYRADVGFWDEAIRRGITTEQDIINNDGKRNKVFIEFIATRLAKAHEADAEIQREWDHTFGLVTHLYDNATAHARDFHDADIAGTRAATVALQQYLTIEEASAALLSERSAEVEEALKRQREQFEAMVDSAASAMDALGAVPKMPGGDKYAGTEAAQEESAKQTAEARMMRMHAEAKKWAELKTAAGAYHAETEHLRDSLMGLADSAGHAFGMMITGQKGAGRAFGDSVKEMLRAEAEWGQAEALKATGLALFDLATGDLAGAASAFAAAGAFEALALVGGSVAALAGPTSSQSAASSAGAGGANTSGANTSGVGAASSAPGPTTNNVTVYLGYGFVGSSTELARELKKTLTTGDLAGTSGRGSVAVKRR